MDTGPIGKFQVLGTLGQGANSTLLHIRRQADSKQYALKIVPIDDPEDKKFLEQAEHEYEIAQKLHNPNLIQIYRLELTKDWLFRVRKVQLLIEYVNGLTLDKMTGLTIPRLVQIFEKIASGLLHMHRRGIYHADLKPGNVLLSRAGDVKIIDYGLAWIKGEAKNRVQGTPEYMAPEQVKKKVVDAKTDIYNFGATMYRLATWRLPPNCVAAQSMGLNASTFHAMLKPVEEFAPAAPKRLTHLIHKCLSYKPSQRPESMKEVHAELEYMVKKLVRSPEDALEAMEF